MKGRKRHVAVDSLGLPVALHVSGAQVQDSETTAAGELLVRLRRAVDAACERLHLEPRLLRVFADVGQAAGDGVREYVRTVKAGEYPAPEHTF